MEKARFLLRVAIGWMFLYGGLTKLMDYSHYSAGFYLKNAQTFPGFYHWLMQPSNIGWVNFLSAWGLTLIGIALIIGFANRLVSLLAALMMVLFYLPILHFPYVGEHGYIVDEHFIYFLVFVVFFFAHPGRYWGLDKKLQNTKFRFLT